MTTVGRAFKIITLLLGFYAVCLGLIAGLVALDVVAFDLGDHVPGLSRYAGLSVLVTIGGVYVVLRGVFVSTRVRAKHLPGIPVLPAEQPVLWQRVTGLAAAAGTRPPKEIRLVQNVNAAVLEHAHLFGLLPGKRRMLIGVPLMQAMTLPQFDAVIAHELGHYSGRDLRLGPLTARARESVLAAQRAVHGSTTRPRRFRLPGNNFFDFVFSLYAQLVLAQTFAMSRQQELAADRCAASVGGRLNAAAALRELPAIDAAYDFYLDRYVAAGIPLGLVPAAPEVLGGFLGFVNDPRRAGEMVKLREEAPEETVDRFDSHPPTAERIKAILALPDDGRPLDESAVRAVGLLQDPARPLGALGAKLLDRHATGRTVADWHAIARAMRLDAARERSLPLVQIVHGLIGRPARLLDLLGLVDAGRFAEVLDRLPPSEQAKRVKATGPVAREFAKTGAGRMIGSWAVLELVQTGRIQVRHAWSDVAGDLVAPDGLLSAVQHGVDGVLAMSPDTAPLRAALTGAGIPA